ncbi:MAG: AsmA family protein [Acidobacteriaceae bacterium]|nr:AsmA family protein [Acidobacteriaceae bacterium]
MRRLLIILGIAAAALICVFLLAASLLNVNKFRPRIQSEMQSKLNRPVTLGELHLHLFPLAIKVDGLTIAESPTFPSSRPFATAKEVYASASLMSLLHGEPQITDVTLDEPQIELIRNTAGIWNISILDGSAPNAASGANAASGSKEPARQGGFTLNKLSVTNGQVAVTDEHSKAPRAIYNHIDLTLSDFAPGKPFDVAADVHVPGQGKELLSFRGAAGPLASGAAEITPVNGQLSIQEVSMAGLNSVAAGAIPPNTDAVASGNATITSGGGSIACKGNLTLDKAVIRGARVSYPIDTQYDLALSPKTDQIAIRSGSVKLGPTVLSIVGTVDSGVTPSNINLRAVTNNASITELSRLASSFDAAANSNDQIKGTISADMTAIGSMKAPQVQGNISASSIQAQELVLTNVHAACKMTNGVVQLAPVTAGVFGGQADGTITVDTKPAHPLCSVNARLNGVDTNALLSAMSSVKNTLYGSLAAQGNLSFAVDSSTNLAGTLNGPLNFSVTNGQLKNVNILNELARIGKFVNTPAVQSASSSNLRQLSGTLNINHGVATTNNLVALLDQGSLSANGSLNLVTQGLNLHMTAVLANTLSKTVGGTGIGGYLNTALANNKGELVLPVIVTGTMAHPVYTPDAEAIAKMKMNQLLPTADNPGSLVNTLLGGAKGKQSGQKNNQQPANPLDSLINSLGKKH